MGEFSIYHWLVALVVLLGIPFLLSTATERKWVTSKATFVATKKATNPCKKSEARPLRRAAGPIN